MFPYFEHPRTSASSPFDIICTMIRVTVSAGHALSDIGFSAPMEFRIFSNLWVDAINFLVHSDYDFETSAPGGDTCFSVALADTVCRGTSLDFLYSLTENGVEIQSTNSATTEPLSIFFRNLQFSWNDLLWINTRIELYQSTDEFISWIVEEPYPLQQEWVAGRWVHKKSEWEREKGEIMEKEVNDEARCTNDIPEDQIDDRVDTGGDLEADEEEINIIKEGSITEWDDSEDMSWIFQGTADWTVASLKECLKNQIKVLIFLLESGADPNAALFSHDTDDDANISDLASEDEFTWKMWEAVLLEMGYILKERDGDSSRFTAVKTDTNFQQKRLVDKRFIFLKQNY